MNKTNNMADDIIDEHTAIFSGLKFTRGSHGYDKVQKWLVKGFIGSQTFGTFFGQSGSHKSFITIDMSCAIATGSPWQGRRTKAGTVVYVASEGQVTICRRVKAWEFANGKEAHELHIVDLNSNMSEPTARDSLIEAIHNIENTFGTKVELIVIDTLAGHFQGDENNSDAMGRFIKGCNLVIKETSATVLCVHHTGKDISKGGRGHSSLNAACDFEFKVVRDEKKGLTTLSNTKQKDAEKAPSLVFDFQPVDLKITCEDGEPITSLASLTLATIKNNKSGTNDENNPVFKALREVFGGSCTREELRKHCFPQREGVAANTTNQKFKRALTALAEQNLVSVHQKGETANRSDIISVVEQLELF
ncbi:helicase RepA family protein [Vibrio metoecus]|uniref:helicase RepA family protein n=1 Tax=Vibrio metoecus TaxID=1481663 RepID=UPI0001B995B3|nr:helicase RepA family protein [Vibrio metoecus]EEX66292.1 regulatory prophage protein [Vibrio metoecus]